MASAIGYSFLIAGMIFILSHLSVDRDFPKGMKNGAIAVSVVFIILYIFFRLL